jgi:diguanylate cyclase (GGDEF)-like protein
VRERHRVRGCLTRIEELASTDPLTGLPDRRRLEQQVETALLEAQLSGSATALLFVDLDGFRTVNDDLGHAAGDDLLVTVTQRLRSRLRRGDLLARLGGDEFLVALAGLDPATAGTEARRVAADLAGAVREPVHLVAGTVTVAASIGVATSPDDGTAFADLLHAADLRVYAQKDTAAR